MLFITLIYILVVSTTISDAVSMSIPVEVEICGQRTLEKDRVVWFALDHMFVSLFQHGA